ncbi:hypothetical protein PENPOL_c002G01657 [Penicillium polonicum]|uniref:Cation transporter n=1 Tax=Penicillium polonicum TaxID=60169 RepID=A0A1V6NX65_PENPO|nr:hypothetical protein PENPOL_c002G01657 [Penicillium polonicum]
MADLIRFSPLTIHYAYFILTPTVCSIIFYTAPTQIDGLHYVDALFMCFSAMTGTGLNVLDLSTLGSLQQAILFSLLILGHAFPIFAFISFLRAISSRTALNDAAAEEKGGQTVSQMPISQLEEHIGCYKEDPLPAKLIDKAKVRMAVREVQADIGLWNAHELCAATDLRHPEETQRGSSVSVNHKGKDIGDWKAHIQNLISCFKGAVHRSANHLSCRDSIRCNAPDGIKYMALCLITGIVILYFIGFLILGIVSIGLWSKFVRPDIPREDKASPFWAGAFLATSALCNNGMSLIDTNMGPYQREPFPLLVCGFLILAGNTLFPCLLRFFIWVLRMMLPNNQTWQLWRRTFDFTLSQPHKVCAYLYPTWHTWFVLGTIIFLNALMWGAFEISAIHNEEIGSLPIQFRVLDGLFQALAVRGGGFSVVAFDRLPQGLLILYVFMMYISAFPVSAAISSTEVADDWPAEQPQQESPRPRFSSFPHGRFVYKQLRSQFSHDIWWLSLAILLITIVESDHFTAEPLAFSTFKIIFEAVSAYSCVGVSIGYPGKSYAFCGAWHTLSKLLLIAVSLRGRHRGLSVIVNTDPFLQPRGVNGTEKTQPEKDSYVNMKETSFGCV